MSVEKLLNQVNRMGTLKAELEDVKKQLKDSVPSIRASDYERKIYASNVAKEQLLNRQLRSVYTELVEIIHTSDGLFQLSKMYHERQSFSGRLETLNKAVHRQKKLFYIAIAGLLISSSAWVIL